MTYSGFNYNKGFDTIRHFDIKFKILMQTIVSIPDFRVIKEGLIKMIIENKPMVRVEKPNADLVQHEMIGNYWSTPVIITH